MLKPSGPGLRELSPSAAFGIPKALSPGSLVQPAGARPRCVPGKEVCTSPPSGGRSLPDAARFDSRAAKENKEAYGPTACQATETKVYLQRVG